MSHEYRYEIKFILNEVNVTTALNWIYTHTSLREKFSGRYVNSLYLDDPDFRAVKDNLVGISKRQKVRLRWYRNLNKISGLALEYKKREGRLGYKDKFALATANNILDQPIVEILASVECLLNDNPSLSCFTHTYYAAVLHTEYFRQYFEDCKGLRVTFDRKITFRNIIPYGKLYDFPLISYPPVIMEIKFSPELKIHVAQLLQKLPMTPKRHSKYLAGLATFGLVSYC
ncbi:MAG: VTC domain-containing protein [Candidatus Electrothrix communis]|nr:MAG: VTC domain-containing protein [Candidatus Electrothrix communis]